MLSRWEKDRQFAARALALKAGALTPQHSAAEAAVDADAEGDNDADRLRRRIQHEAEPYPIEVPEVDCADLGKRYREAFDTPDGYPPMRMVDAEQFRRRPVAAGHAADSPGYGPPGQAVPVPSATLAPGMVTRPLLTAGRSRPCAPEAY
jgi:hypothetical protein